MKRNKLCIIIAILTSIFLFGTAAVYNQCSTSTETITGKVEEEITPEGEKKSEEVIEGEEEGAEEETLHKETEKISEEEAVAETQAPEEAIEGEESVDENGGMGGGEKRPRSAPTIKLEIYEGPTFSEADRVCYYRIQARVTGEPTPTVEFSRDDSLGTLGPGKTQVNINNPSETYTLTATATNSMGSATDYIDIDWGCFIGVSIRASDLGYVIEDNGVNNETLIIGDSIQNRNVRGFFAFDIGRVLSGKTIDFASMTLHTYKLWGNPTFKGKIIIYFCDYLPLTPEDYRIHPYYTLPLSFENDEEPIFYTSDYLRDIIQEKADSGEKLQFAINYESSSSNMDSQIDGREYADLDDIYLAIKYFD